MEVAAAHAGTDDAHEGVGRLPEGRVRHIDDADVARAEQVGGSHGVESTPVPAGAGVTVVTGTASASLVPRTGSTVET